MTAVPRKRIALLINQVDGGYQSPIWHAVDDVCGRRDCDLAVFAGKAPFSPLEEEIQYNTIYKLVRSESFDGMILTSGTLANYIGEEAFAGFCKSFAGIPMVSISQPVKGMASVTIDNYSGMKDAVTHLVRHHGFTEVAFIRGPETNQEAEDRYRAYVDALTEAGLSIESEMVFPGDFREFTARDAVRSLCDGKKDLPQAIVAANDDMAMAVYDELSKRGYRIPDDIRVTGFDDLESVRSIDPPLTTVGQPLYGLGEAAANLLLDCLSETDLEHRASLLASTSIRLPANLVVRQSCGCSSFAADGRLAAHETDHFPTDNPDYEAFNRDVRELRAALENEIDGAPNGVMSALKPLLGPWSRRDVPLSRWLKILYGFKDDFSGERKTAADAVIMRSMVMIGELMGPEAGVEKLRMGRVLNSLRLIDVRLHRAFSLPRFTEALAGILFISGIREAYLCLYHSPVRDLCGTDWKMPRQARLVMAYDENGVILSEDNWQSFPSSDLLPRAYLLDNTRKTLIFLPLFIHDRHFGYLALGSTGSDDLVYETLRERISAAYHSVMLFRREKKAEEKLRTALDILQKSEERYKEMAVLLPSVIIETDANLSVTFVNQAGREAFNLSDIDINRGVSLSSFVHPDDSARLADYRLRSLALETVLPNEFRLVKNDAPRTILLGKAQAVLQGSRVCGFRWGVMDLKPYIEQNLTVDDELFKKYHFSPRENEVLAFILRGAKIKDISERLFISESTVKGHVTSIYSKIGIKNREELFELIKDHQVNRNGYESFIYSMLIKLFQN